MVPFTFAVFAILLSARGTRPDYEHAQPLHSSEAHPKESSAWLAVDHVFDPAGWLQASIPNLPSAAHVSAEGRVFETSGELVFLALLVAGSLAGAVFPAFKDKIDGSSKTAWQIGILGVVYICTVSAQGLLADVYKFCSPGKGQIDFSVPVAFMTSRLLAWAFGLGYVCTTDGVAGIRRSLDVIEILRYSGTSILYASFELCKGHLLGSMNSVCVALLITWCVVPLALAQYVVFGKHYSALQVLQLAILSLAGSGFLQDGARTSWSVEVVYLTCFTVFAYVTANVTGEALLKMKLHEPVILQCNWTWPGEIALAMLCESYHQVQHGRLMSLHTFRNFNLVVWLMTIAMAVHCLYSTFFTKCADSAIKAMAVVCSLVFPTFFVNVLLGIEHLHPLRRPMLGIIAVLAAVSFSLCKTTQTMTADVLGKSRIPKA